MRHQRASGRSERSERLTVVVVVVSTPDRISTEGRQGHHALEPPRSSYVNEGMNICLDYCIFSSSRIRLLLRARRFGGASGSRYVRVLSIRGWFIFCCCCCCLFS